MYIKFSSCFTQDKLHLPDNEQQGDTVSEIISVMSATNNSVGKIENIWNVQAKGTYSCSYRRNLNIIPTRIGTLLVAATKIKDKWKDHLTFPTSEHNQVLTTLLLGEICREIELRGRQLVRLGSSISRQRRIFHKNVRKTRESNW